MSHPKSVIQWNYSFFWRKDLPQKLTTLLLWFSHFPFLIKRPFRVLYLIEVHFLPKYYSTYTDLFTDLKFGRNWNSIWYITRNCLEQKTVISSHSFALILFFLLPKSSEIKPNINILVFPLETLKPEPSKYCCEFCGVNLAFKKVKKSLNLWFWARDLKTVKSSRDTYYSWMSSTEIKLGE